MQRRRRVVRTAACFPVTAIVTSCQQSPKTRGQRQEVNRHTPNTCHARAAQSCPCHPGSGDGAPGRRRPELPRPRPPGRSKVPLGAVSSPGAEELVALGVSDSQTAVWEVVRGQQYRVSGSRCEGWGAGGDPTSEVITDQPDSSRDKSEPGPGSPSETEDPEQMREDTFLWDQWCKVAGRDPRGQC